MPQRRPQGRTTRRSHRNFHHEPLKVADDTWLIRQLQGEAQAPVAVYINSMLILGDEPIIVDTGSPARDARPIEVQQGNRRIAGLELKVLAGAHSPIVTGSGIDHAMTMLRELPTSEVAAMPQHAELEAMLAAISGYGYYSFSKDSAIV